MASFAEAVEDLTAMKSDMKKQIAHIKNQMKELKVKIQYNNYLIKHFTGLNEKTENKN
jgi:hypothetical protein